MPLTCQYMLYQELSDIRAPTTRVFGIDPAAAPLNESVPNTQLGLGRTRILSGVHGGNHKCAQVKSAMTVAPSQW